MLARSSGSSLQNANLTEEQRAGRVKQMFPVEKRKFVTIDIFGFSVFKMSLIGCPVRTVFLKKSLSHSSLLLTGMTISVIHVEI
jgi:hypothetical protein